MRTEIKVYFVIPVNCNDETFTNETMQEAYKICCKNQLSTTWKHEKEIFAMDFVKQDIVVLHEFAGETFTKLKASSCTILGPWCIINSLLDGLPVPNNKSPVFNMSMNKLIITASHLTVDEKRVIKEKVELMGGIFILQITKNVTHLITDSVQTEKYVAAAEKNIPVMLKSWVEDVWTQSQERIVLATDSIFDKHKCPPLQNLRICCTGFDFQERNKISKLITENGGEYSGRLATRITDILICNPGVQSEKITVAKKSNVPCLRAEWLYDSVEKGYAQVQDNYLIKIISSTPTKSSIPLNVDFSMMSAISDGDNADNNALRTSVSDTLNFSLLSVDMYNRKSKGAKCTNVDEQKENEKPTDYISLDAIDLKRVKEAGAFLDGCGVYLTGFNTANREKMCRILRCAGATRYDEISDRVSHIICGTKNLDPNEVRVLKMNDQGLPILSVEWLIECTKQAQPVPEDNFLIYKTPNEENNCPINTDSNRISSESKRNNEQMQQSSPLVKKGLSLLQHDETLLNLEELQQQQQQQQQQQSSNDNTQIDAIIQLYNNNNVTMGPSTSVFGMPNCSEQNETEQSTNASETIIDIFDGKTFKLLRQTADELVHLTDTVKSLGGHVVPPSPAYKASTDYIIVPAFSNALKQQSATQKVLNNYWIYDCKEEEKIVPIKYYHYPIDTGNCDTLTILQKCVITISGYVGYERQFLTDLIKFLGGTFQQNFARVTLPDRSVLASTHLISLDRNGAKFNASIRWKRLAVTHEWLMACCEQRKRVSEKLYTLTDDVETNKSTSNKNSTATAAAKAPTTPSNTSGGVKRDSNGIEKSSTSATRSEIPLIEQLIETNEPSSKKIKGDDHVTDTIITVEDGRQIAISKYMAELRERGLMDTPSPPPPLEVGTPALDILARLRTEGKIPTRDHILKRQQQRRNQLNTSSSTTPKATTTAATGTNATESPGKGPKTPAWFKSNFGNTGNGGSPSTPVTRYLRSLQERKMLSPAEASVTPEHNNTPPLVPMAVKTPDTPLGRFLGEDSPSAETRKRWHQYLEKMPHYKLHDRPPVKERRKSTPLREVKNRVWAMLLGEDYKQNTEPDSEQVDQEDNSEINTNNEENNGDEDEDDDDVENNVVFEQIKDTNVTMDSSTSSKNEPEIPVDMQINRLKQLLHRRSTLNNMSKCNDDNKNVNNEDGSNNGPGDTTKLTKKYALELPSEEIGWDYEVNTQLSENTTQKSESKIENQVKRIFMLSSLDTTIRENCCSIIESLGGEISKVNYYDTSATHVICGSPIRNEKILSSMAAGKWILHYKYIEDCGKENKFLNEEYYEFGNPKASDNISHLLKGKTNVQIEPIYWWRTRILTTKCKPYFGMRALIFAKNKVAIQRLIEAGGGTVLPNASHEPPFDHNLDASHCFIEQKHYADLEMFKPIAEQGIYCLNILYLSNYLNNLSKIDINEFFIPSLRNFNTHT